MADQPQQNPGALDQQRDDPPPGKPWWKFWTRDYHVEVRHLTVNYSAREREKQILRIVEDNKFNRKIFFVAASGFLASSYSLFATNVIVPAVYFVNPPCGRLDSRASLVIDQLTLIGAVLGMISMGHLADRAGRRKLYGLELLALIIATLGVVQASEGFIYQNDDGSYEHSMDVYAWFAWWRTILGIGIGAEYPLSAVITAEWASTKSRGRMLAAVKSMQSFARILAVAIGLAALRTTAKRRGLDPDAILGSSAEANKAKVVVDEVWRWVIGIAVIPAAIAIGARLTIPETPRYYVDIMKDLRQAVKNALKLHKRSVKLTEEHAPEAGRARQDSGLNEHWFRGAWTYLKQSSYEPLRNLLIITTLWGIMDVGFYGLSLDSPSALSTLFRSPSTQPISPSDPANSKRAEMVSCPEFSSWRPESEPATTTIYHMLELNSHRSLLVSSIASVAGSIVAIMIVNRFHRRMILVTTFTILALLFTITGATLISTHRAGQKHTSTLVFYALTQFIYNAGPNTMIFILAAEIFPTVYRGTFYGLAAAGGKVGAIAIRAIIGRTGNNDMSLGIRLLIFVPLMLAAAWLSWYLPEVQRFPRVENVAVTTQSAPDIEMGILPTMNGGHHSPIIGIFDPPTEAEITAQGQEQTVRGQEQPVPGHEQAVRDGPTVLSDGTASDSEDGHQDRLARPWWSRLENKTLERIAPNPRLEQGVGAQ